MKVRIAQQQSLNEKEEAPLDKEDYLKAEEIVKEALRTMQKTEQEVALLPKMVSSSPKADSTPLSLSPKTTPRRESSSSTSSVASSASKKVIVRFVTMIIWDGVGVLSLIASYG